MTGMVTYHLFATGKYFRDKICLYTEGQQEQMWHKQKHKYLPFKALTANDIE